MRILEVYTPELDTNVQYKVLAPEDVEIFAVTHSHLPKEDYTRMVLERVISNLKHDVTESLKRMEKQKARRVLESLYNGALMLNPGFDLGDWLNITNATRSQEESGSAERRVSAGGGKKVAVETAQQHRRIVTRQKFRGLEAFLKRRIIGQDEAIDQVVRTLKRSVAGLNDSDRPLGVFFFAGASGVGKTELAKCLQEYLYGSDNKLIRIDCGEFQQKHENQKLIGAPPGYIGYEKGGQLTKPIEEVQGQAVILIDEVEEAHPDLFNTFLRMFDEGLITDGQGTEHSVRDAIIIMTSNLGSQKTAQNISAPGMGFGGSLDLDINKLEFPQRTMVERHAMQAIRKTFAPKFLNRIDRIVVFNHLTPEDLHQIVDLEFEHVNEKLKRRGMKVSYEPEVVEAMIDEGVNPIEGARGLSRIRREKVEDLLSDALLERSRWPRGTVFKVTWTPDEGYQVVAERPQRKATA